MSASHEPDSGESGAALVWVAGSLVALLAFAALAIDLGWFWVQNSRLQRAADASALAAVVHVPGALTVAETDGRTAARINGFETEGVDATTAFTGTLVDDDKYSVTLESEVELFFAPVIGWDTMPLKAQSTAQYIKPIPLGSDGNCIGRDPTGSVCTGSDPNLWAAISGRRTNKRNGDAYATECFDSGGPWNCQRFNGLYRPAGYYFAVEVPANAGNVSIMAYDAGFYNRPSFGVETGDRVQDQGGGANTQFRVLDFDSTPADPTDNSLIPGCVTTISSGASSSVYRDLWVELCPLGVDPAPGIYVVQVSTTGNLGGTNQFTLGATGTTANPRVYPINDMSIFNNDDDSDAIFKLAEIDEVYAGKEFKIELYDPGEAPSGSTLSILDPSGAVPTCTWWTVDEFDNASSTTAGPCTIQTADGSGPLFNGEWLNISIDLPDSASYNCSPDCWWEVRYNFTSGDVTDRTTWQAYVIGNPLRLIENP